MSIEIISSNIKPLRLHLTLIEDEEIAAKSTENENYFHCRSMTFLCKNLSNETISRFVIISEILLVALVRSPSKRCFLFSRTAEMTWWEAKVIGGKFCFLRGFSWRLAISEGSGRAGGWVAFEIWGWISTTSNTKLSLKVKSLHIDELHLLSLRRSSSSSSMLTFPEELCIFRVTSQV